MFTTNPWGSVAAPTIRLRILKATVGECAGRYVWEVAAPTIRLRILKVWPTNAPGRNLSSVAAPTIRLRILKEANGSELCSQSAALQRPRSD